MVGVVVGGVGVGGVFGVVVVHWLVGCLLHAGVSLGGWGRQQQCPGKVRLIPTPEQVL